MKLFFAGCTGGRIREKLLFDTGCSRMFSYHLHKKVIDRSTEESPVEEFEMWLERNNNENIRDIS